MRKVAHLTSVHPPVDTRIFHKECRTLAQAGYRVTLVVPTDRDAVREGVHIKAVPFPSSRADRVLNTTRHVFREAVAENADLYHLHDPELLPIGVLLRLLGHKVVYDAHENFPKLINARAWFPDFLRQAGPVIVDICERALVSLLHGVIAANPGTPERFSNTQSALIRNYPLLEEFEWSSTDGDLPPYNQRPSNVVYVGQLTNVRGAKEMVRAIDRVPHPGARLALGGKFSTPEFEKSCQRLDGWKKTDFHGWLSRSEVSSTLSNARVGLAVIHAVPSYKNAYPTKMYEYMAAELPVVVSDFPLYRQVVEDAQCGLLVDPSSPEDISKAIQWLLNHPDEAEAMGQRGRRAVLEKYNWGNEAATLISFYEQVLDDE